MLGVFPGPGRGPYSQEKIFILDRQRKVRREALLAPQPSFGSTPWRTCAAALLGAGLILGALPTLPLPVDGAVSVRADEVDELIKEVETISQETNAKNEEVKALEDQIGESEKALEGKRAEVDAATKRADDALAKEKSLQGEVNIVAGAKYRGSIIDPITNAMGASNPQTAIDRAAYLTTLARRTEDAVKGLSEATERAAEAHTDAARAAAQAEFQLNNLKKQHEELDKQRQELEQRTEEVKRRVDSLSVADRLRWIQKNGPITAGLEAFAGTSGVVDAAMTRLGAPYGWGATGPNVFDCSGLVQWSYAQQGKHIPRTSQAQVAGGIPVSRDQLQPGDVVGFYPGVTHVGIYVGNGQIVHASDYGIPVQVVPLDSMPFAGAARY